ncbi:MAG: AAA family ATPase [Candidatus Brocadiia bacterium]
MQIYCGLCGHKAHELFSHLRSVHEMSPDRYRDRCPQAPLVSEDLASYILDNRIVPHGDSLKKRVGLFGFQFACDILPDEMTPAPEEDYVLQEGLCRKVLAGLKASEKMLLVGPTGVGKSTLIEQLAARLNWPVVRVAASGGLTEADLLGEWTVRDGETVFNYGFLPRAMRMGAICLIDEIDGMEPSVAFSIHQLMEDHGKLVLLQNGGEIIEPDPSFRLVCTANTLGHGDETGLYTGTRVLNAAFLDRFASVMRMGYLPPEREVEVILSRAPGFSRDMARALVKVAGGVRRAQENDEVYCTFSTRRLIDVARKHTQLDDLEAALDLAVLSRLSDSDRMVVEEICQRQLGEVG